MGNFFWGELLTFFVPFVCFVFWVLWLVQSIRFFRIGGRIKLSMLLMAVIGIPLSVAYLLQYFGIINCQELAKGLGSSYYSQRVQDNLQND